MEVVGGILRERGRILLGLRSPHRSFASCWDVIGGHVEPGETPADALIREVREEIGIDVASATFVRRLDLGFVDARPMLLHLFLVNRWKGVPLLANDEHSELRWFDPHEAACLSGLALAEYRSVFADLAHLPSSRT